MLGTQDAQPNRILLVTIHHMLYPITVEVLHQVFSPHGFVEKIVTFQKSAGQLLQVFSLSLSNMKNIVGYIYFLLWIMSFILASSYFFMLWIIEYWDFNLFICVSKACPECLWL
jgi:hypothetical protein